MHTTVDTTNILTDTKHWVSEFIIKHNICPFAKREFERDSIYYDVITTDKLEEQLEALISACEQLNVNQQIETSLLILPNGLQDFADYLDMLWLANELMHKQGYEGIYQLASFHPHYLFEGVEKNDASHFTNRSPYPMLHLIREVSIEKALESYPNPETIPQRNIEYLRSTEPFCNTKK